MVYTPDNAEFDKFGVYFGYPQSPYDDRGPYHSYWHKINMDLFEGEQLVTGYLNIESHEPLVSELECHPECAEIFICVDGSGIIALCRPDDCDDMAIRYFRLKKGDAVLIRKGVWHKLPVPDGSRIGFLMLVPERILGNIVKRNVDPPVPIESF